MNTALLYLGALALGALLAEVFVLFIMIVIVLVDKFGGGK